MNVTRREFAFALEVRRAARNGCLMGRTTSGLRALAAGCRNTGCSDHFPLSRRPWRSCPNRVSGAARDLGCPNTWNAMKVRLAELPVFWACGVASHAALVSARLSMCITPSPAAMLVIDLLSGRACSALKFVERMLLIL